RSRPHDQPLLDVAVDAESADTERMVRALLPTNLQIVTEAPDGALWVRADASQLNQVLVNLGSNAAHAQPGGGRIEISLRRVRLDAAALAGRDGSPPGAYACLAVRDEGTGMDATTVQRMFEPFFTTKPPGQGTGLGLAVVHGIVRTHAGAIQV